jgi:hypothetical protein
MHGKLPGVLLRGQHQRHGGLTEVVQFELLQRRVLNVLHWHLSH